MARRKPKIEDTLAWTIYQEMILYTKDKQVIAGERAFYSWVLHEKYPKMTLGEYRYHFGELVKARYISIDSVTRAVHIPALLISERDNAPFLLE
jgi:hypothetical protein